MKKNIGLFCIVFTLHHTSFSDSKILVLNKDPIVTIDAATHKGSGHLRLRNTGKDTAKLSLYSSAFTYRANGKQVHADLFFSAKDFPKEEPFLDAKIAPDQLFVATVTVAAFRVAGEAQAAICNGRDTLTTIKAVKFDVPFALSIEPEINIGKKTTSFLVLKNDDPVAYPVTWNLFFPGVDTPVAQSRALVPAKSSLAVPLPPLWNRVPENCKKSFMDYPVPARVTVRFTPNETVEHESMATKVIPLRATFSKAIGDTGIYSLLIAFLFLGSICSLILYVYIPNEQKKSVLLKSLNMLGCTISSISGRIDSALRVSVRVERIRIFDTIRSRKMFLPVGSDFFTECESAISRLGKKATQIVELDKKVTAVEQLQAKCSDAPPALLDTIIKGIRDATELLTMPVLEDADLQTVRQIVQTVQDRIVSLNASSEDGAFAEKLAGQIAGLSAEYDETDGCIGKLPKCKEIRPRLQVLFDIFNDPHFTDKNAIRPHHYHWLSSSVERLSVLRHYIREWEYASPDRAWQSRIQKHEATLIELLRLRTWNALHEARLMRREIEEDIYTEDIASAIAEGAYTLSSTPLFPSPNQAVQLGIQFNNKKFNTCAARFRFSCIRDFGKIGKETGWDIAHFFRLQKEANYTVVFQGPDGKPVTGNGSGESASSGAKLTLQSTSKGKSILTRNLSLEGIKFFIALLVAILGLAAGAKEQLVKLDPWSGLIAVFMLGFSADSIKNLLTRRNPAELKAD